MGFFIPPLIWLGAAGLAALGVLGTGCAPQIKPQHPSPKPTPKPPAPKLPATPQEPKFRREDLEVGETPGAPDSDGYQMILGGLSRDFATHYNEPIPLKEYNFSGISRFNAQLMMRAFISEPRKAQVAKQFVEHLATHDGRADDISRYDYLFASYHLYGEQWGQDWQKEFLVSEDRYPFSIPQSIKILGKPLVDPESSSDLSSQSRDLLQSLATYVKALPPQDQKDIPVPLLEFFLEGKEPPVFPAYLGVSFGEFLNLEEEKRVEVFRKAIAKHWPNKKTIEELALLLSPQEFVHLTMESFAKDVEAALPLFESLTLPEAFSKKMHGLGRSNEVNFFPNLPQDTPYAERQKAIDVFLGDPVLVKEKRHRVQGGRIQKTSVKKYNWVGDTDVFSIESGKPGPTTLVFVPHYHERNPRKMFHWIKDTPLQSGRVILLPEANAAMARAGRSTRPMNDIFNEALLSQRIDYLIVRRVEYLMGLVDGTIGVHDAGAGPFYISDVIVEEDGSANAQLGPIPSPYVPKKVRRIKEIKYGKREDDPIQTDNQVQWQMAAYSREKLQKLSGVEFFFSPDPIKNKRSPSVDSTTGYMNYLLRKPAMTFEGNERVEHGQMHAMAIYTLLLAFGHRISSRFEKKLKDFHPVREDDLYVGLYPEPGRAY